MNKAVRRFGSALHSCSLGQTVNGAIAGRSVKTIATIRIIWQWHTSQPPVARATQVLIAVILLLLASFIFFIF